MPPSAPRIGQDVVDVARLRRALRSHEAGFRRRVFTPGEWEENQGRADAEAALAACFAAKEAAFKALGTGWGRGVAWRDVETRRQGPREAADEGADEGADAAPHLVLHGRAAEFAREAGLLLTVSLAHTPHLAVAMVLAQPA